MKEVNKRGSKGHKTGRTSLLQVRIKEDLKNNVYLLAKKNDQFISELVEAAIEAYLKKERAADLS